MTVSSGTRTKLKYKKALDAAREEGAPRQTGEASKQGRHK